MKRRQPHRTGPHGHVLMHSPLHRATRAAGYHEQEARHDSSVLAAEVSCHAASTAAPCREFPPVGHDLAATRPSRTDSCEHGAAPDPSPPAAPATLTAGDPPHHPATTQPHRT